MRIVLAGPTGVIGRELVPMLSGAGHEVVGLSRSQGTDVLDPDAVISLFDTTRPDAIIHMATAIPASINPRRMVRDYQLTNRLRREGTRNLLEAAQQVGTPRFISQSLAYAYHPAGGLAEETAPLWQQPPKQFASVLDALVDLEQRTIDAGGLVLRFGHLHGPGTISAPDGSFTAQIKAGRVPIVGSGQSVFSFTHTSDAAAAIVAALDTGTTGVLNIVDDDPSETREWLPEFARRLDAPVPKHLPTAIAKLAVGGWGAAFMTQLRGRHQPQSPYHTGLETRPPVLRLPLWH
jgi:nucleoside-diphosphate-sugar epimerase